jgi:hypothetical protein
MLKKTCYNNLELWVQMSDVKMCGCGWTARTYLAGNSCPDAEACRRMGKNFSMDTFPMHHILC